MTICVFRLCIFFLKKRTKLIRICLRVGKGGLIAEWSFKGNNAKCVKLLAISICIIFVLWSFRKSKKQLESRFKIIDCLWLKNHCFCSKDEEKSRSNLFQGICCSKQLGNAPLQTWNSSVARFLFTEILFYIAHSFRWEILWRGKQTRVLFKMCVQRT